MARTVLPATTALGEFGSYAANAADVTMTAADTTNQNYFDASAKDVVFAHNTGAVARTVTITSVPDGNGRTGDIAAYSIGAGEYAAFGPFTTRQGFRQADGRIHLEANNAEVKLGIVRIP